jgi:Icc-related predicted phosphoesterase
MRLLVAADLHYSLPQFDWVLNSADQFDLVILAGDQLDLSSLVDGRAQAMVVQKYVELLQAKTRVMLCSGNHDLDSRGANGEKTAAWISNFNNRGIPADGQAIVIDGVLFSICPWWDGPLAREGIKEQLARDALKRAGAWFWVHHAPPDKSPTSWSGARYMGDVELLQWIEQYKPDMVFSGHVHQSPFTKAGSWVDRIGDTWVFNAGHQFGSPPAYIVLDTVSNEAVWMSAAGIQSVRLDAALERPLPRLMIPPAWFTSRNPASGPIPG